ncbi:hypothetical protein [Streptomyces seoulensis]|uniref:hypothetical protein n=1 Tax=Streptomyces seoulensis TaxID=73044 RepID=UPI001FD12DA6|nr:hypothetical protein [Streptomyces seoulensis]
MTAITPPPPTATAAPAWRDVYVLAGMRGLSFAGDIAAATALTLLLQANGAGSYAVMALLLAAAVPRRCWPRSPAGSPTASTAAASSSRSPRCRSWPAWR